MLTRLMPALSLAIVMLPLAACTSGPQQPSDIVDDQSSSAAGSITGGVSQPTSSGPLEQPRGSIDAFIGAWADASATCQSPGPSVTFTASRMETLQRACDIADIVDGGDGRVTIGLQCTSPDDSLDGQLVKLSPTPAGIEMTVVGGDSGPQSLVRCP